MTTYAWFTAALHVCDPVRTCQSNSLLFTLQHRHHCSLSAMKTRHTNNLHEKLPNILC